MGEQRKAKNFLKKNFSPDEEEFLVWPVRAWYHFLSENRIGKWYSNTILTPATIFIEFLERLWGWIPIIWKDRDWDEHYMLRILQYKIKRMREVQLKYGHGENKFRIAKQMRYAEILIDRILEDDYHTEEWDKHIKKWGEYCRRRKWTDGSPVGRAYNIRQNATTPVKYSQQMIEETAIVDRQRKTLEKDKDRLFRHIRRYMNTWWD